MRCFVNYLISYPKSGRQWLVSLLLFALPFFVVPTAPFAATAPFQAGQDYTQLSETHLADDLKSPPGKTEVIEFFSYGCPWCRKLEPDLEAWLQKKQKDVRFLRVPVVFESHWEVLARAYYVAKGLNKENFNLLLFAAAQDPQAPITTVGDLKTFFEKQNVSGNDFDNAYHSPVIDAQISRAENYLRAYEIDAVPAIVIGGKYKVTFSMARGNSKRFFDTVDYLIKKADKEKRVKEF